MPPACPYPPLFGQLATQAIATGLDLGCYSRLADGPAIAKALAKAAGVSARRLTPVLDALVGLGQLERTDHTYRLPDSLHAMLQCPGVDADAYFGGFAEHLRCLIAAWAHLTEVVTKGRPAGRMNDAQDAGRVFPRLVFRLFPPHYLAAKALLARLPARFRKQALRVLDVGAGSGAWGLPFAEQHPQTRLSLLDFAPVLPVAKHFAAACGVADQVTLWPGDLRRVRYPKEAFDLVILGHVCHSLGERATRRLLGKLHAALRPRGRLLIVDFLPDDARQGEGGGLLALLFALNMLVNTDDGGTFTTRELRAWAREAGFRRFAGAIAVPGPASVLAFDR